MKKTATQVNSSMSHWMPDTRCYTTSDGRYLAVYVHADLNDKTRAHVEGALAEHGIPTFRAGIHTIVVSPTTIVECNADGIAEELTAAHTFPPGTTHEEALRLAGYVLISNGE